VFCNVVLQEVDIEKELGVELGHDDDDEAEEEKHEGASSLRNSLQDIWPAMLGSAASHGLQQSAVADSILA
jgi:hypothetical protein